MPNAVPYVGPNRLLSSLSQEDYALLSPHLGPVLLTIHQRLEVANEFPESIYFPEGGVASVAAMVGSQKDFDVGLIGWEGMTGASVLFGAPSPFNCYVLFVGPALEMPARAFMDSVSASSTLRSAVFLYSHALSIQTAYTALASARASIIERVARSLVMIYDRVDAVKYRVTHDKLAGILGVRRPGVTNSIHQLQDEHLIKSTRGEVQILDLGGLRIRSGAAYGQTERSYEELIEVVDPTMVPIKFRSGP